MSNVSPRINASFSHETFAWLTEIAAKKRVSLSRLVNDLVEQALENDEDERLAQISDRIYESNKDKPKYTHEQAWAHLNDA